MPKDVPNTMLNHTLSRSNSSAYATQDEMTVMRCCSKPQIPDSPVSPDSSVSPKRSGNNI